MKDPHITFPADINGLVKLGAVTAEVSKEKEMLYAVVPDGYKLQTHDLAERNERMDERRFEIENQRPLRNRGLIRVADVDSFTYMVGRENIQETTIVLADMQERSFNAVINFAQDGKTAGFSDRCISLELVKTLEFQRWNEMNRRRLSQRQLADFLEENLENIADPPAAEVVEMITNLKVKRNATYHSVIDTQTGAQSISFSEDIKGETVNGSMDFRSKFSVVITPFIGSSPYNIDCSMRFSTDESRLQVFFSMLNLAKVEEHAFNAENDKIREAMKKLGVPVINVR